MMVIAIATLFVRLLFDCFKPRQRLEAEILAVASENSIFSTRGEQRIRA
jgi:hypothetical protein